jgi:hypothetical protein
MICPTCRGSLYVLDSRYVRRFTTGEKAKKELNSQFQVKLRYWSCIECGNRYMSTEVLNPSPYTNKPMPPSRVKCILG